MAKKLFQARAVIEIAGKPKQHVEDVMRLVIEKLKKEEGIKILKSKIHHAKEHSGVFNIFSDIELEFQGQTSVMLFCFEYMPSSIEFLEPEELKVNVIELNEIFNDILARLHETDRRLKEANASNIILEKNAGNLLKMLITLNLRAGDKSMEELAKAVGIVPTQLKPFLDRYVQEKIIKAKENSYSIQNGSV